MSELNAVRDLSVAPSREGDPSIFLATTNYMDPEDPVDQALLGLQRAVAGTHDALPTEAEQLRLVNGMLNDDLDSARRLIDRNQGIIAAVAYPFKCGGVDPEELMEEGARALVRSAKTYDRDDDEAYIFSDHAIAAIHDLFRSRWPELAADSYIEDQRYPMERVYYFAETLEEADTPLKMARKRDQDQNRFNGRLYSRHNDILALINLSNKEIAARLRLNESTVSHRLSEAKERLGVDTREAAAVAALQRGMVMDVPEITDRSAFSIRQRQVAMRLDGTNKAISEELGLTKRQLDRTMADLYKKTGARTRAELTLMARLNDFEPTEEELDPPDKPFVETLDSLQIEIFQRMIHQQDAEMADELPVSVAAIQRIAQKAVDQTGVYDRTQLILLLHRQGMDFEVIEPAKPVVDILSARDIDIIRHLSLPYEEIAQRFGFEDKGHITNIIYRAKHRVGARSRHELALLVDMIDEADGQPMEIDRSTNEWRLAQRLGLKTLEACDVDALLLAANEVEREAVTAYYLGGKAVKLSEVSAQLGISEPAVRSRLMRGVNAMKANIGDLMLDSQ